MKHKKSKKHSLGFTLIELLVVISVIGVLSSTVMVATNRSRIAARDIRRVQEIKNIQTAIELYYQDFGEYPKVNPPTMLGTYNAASNNAASWNDLAAKLSNYTKIKSSYAGNNSKHFYFYNSPTTMLQCLAGDDKTVAFSGHGYGLMADLEDENGANGRGDAGIVDSWYEVYGGSYKFGVPPNCQ